MLPTFAPVSHLPCTAFPLTNNCLVCLSVQILEYIMMCLQCFMWCLEKIMKFINKHAYIITAIYGHSFCKSARKAFWLLLR